MVNSTMMVGTNSSSTNSKIINQGIIDANLANVCRGCLDEGLEMTDAFTFDNQQHDSNSNFINMFYECTAIQISLYDEMPSLICTRCQENVKRANKFKIQCLASQEFLQRHMIKDNDVKLFTKPLSHLLLDTVDARSINDRCDDNISEEKIDIETIEIQINKKQIYTEKRKSINASVQDIAKVDKVVSGMVREEQKLRLTQYSVEEVNRALQNAQEMAKEIKRECRHCGFVAASARGLRVHVSHIHKHLLNSLCSKCCEFIVNKDDHKDCQPHYVCEFCNKNFTTRTHLIEHLRSHTVVRPYICSFCSKSFISDRHLKVHLRTHSGEKPFCCKICDKKFSQKSAMHSHMKIVHKNEEDIKDCLQTCTVCSFEVENLNSHMRVHEKKIREESCLCTECGKTFGHNAKLRLHMRVHTGELPYGCSHCEKRFTTRSQMMVHIRVHTGEKPHVCSFCGKRFAQSSVLNTHMRIHTGRPEECKICNQRFCRPAELRLHMRKHTGEKPYECKQCGQAFRQASHLTQHLNTHSEERPFKCAYCDRGFKQNSSLKSHEHIHTGYKPFQCNKCYYACRQSYSLTQHMKTHALDSE